MFFNQFKEKDKDMANAIGSDVLPVYINGNGVPKPCSTPLHPKLEVIVEDLGDPDENVIAEITVDGRTYTIHDASSTPKVIFKDELELDPEKQIIAKIQTVIGSDVVPPTPPTHVGKVFDHWDGTYKNVQKTEVVWARYRAAVYTVTFRMYKGGTYTTLKIEQVEYGKSATAPERPTYEGMITSDWDVPFNNITGNLIVTCTVAGVLHLITFMNNGMTEESILQQTRVPYGDIPTYNNIDYETGQQIDPVYENPDPGKIYTFKGWNPSIVPVTEDATYVADYDWAWQTFTVTFNIVFGDVTETIETQTVNWGTGATAPELPDREGYDKGTWDKDFTNIKADTVVTATYSIKKFTVTFKPDNGEADIVRTDVPYGTPIGRIKPENQSKTEYEFIGWDKTDDYEVKSDTTVTAQYGDIKITEVSEDLVDYTQVVSRTSASHWFKNFMVEDASHLAHVGFTDAMLYDYTNSIGTIFKTETGTESSELNGTNTKVTKTLGRGGTKFKYTTIKNNRLITAIDFVPTMSIHCTTPNQAYLSTYRYGPNYWDDGTAVGSYVDIGSLSLHNSGGRVVHFGSKFKIVLHINDNGTMREVSKVVDDGLTNSVTKLSISSLSGVNVSFSDEIKALGLHKNAYTTQVDIMESTSTKPERWWSALICGLRFYVDSINN